MNKVFTIEQAKKVNELSEALRGKKNYGEYLMELEYKYGNKWKYVGFGTPPTNAEGTIKTYKGVSYIYYKNNGEERRYQITDSVKKLFEKKQSNSLKEQIEQYLEMLESDYEGFAAETTAEKKVVAMILSNYIKDLREILDETAGE